MANKEIKLYELKKLQTDFPSTKLTNSKESSAFIRQFYGDDIEIFESFFILMMNTGLKTIGYAKISQGGVSSTIVDLKILAKYAIDSLASSVIIAHNHPSGSLIPSDDDRRLTNKIKEALKLFDINVVDHIILTKEEYFSFAEEGLI